ncbi:DUF2867 domain-containing protein [Thiorhodospira sibirica]|uniref:DUF2867 domain-containing protein n=1 Tax=Thiorhodospira sibirica TaxID=154347 RepID=UPI00022C33AE|nr:DUF2867 domain-containing protein [Thiorhodospira sibirica]
MKVLVFGASGYIGTNLVPKLVSAGLTVRAAARSMSVLKARDWQGVELVKADVLQPDTLAPALEGVEIAYYLVHSMASGKSFGRLDIEAAANFAKAAEAAGVKRIIYLGGLLPPNAKSEHIISRAQTGEELRRGVVPVTEIRAGIIVGPGSAAFEVMRDLVLHLPIMVTPRWVRAKSPPIALENLLEYLHRVAFIPEAAGKTFDAAGPEHIPYDQAMRILAKEAGHKPPIILPVPLLSPKLSSYWLKWVTAVPTSVARALIEGLREDFIADDRALRALVPQPLLDFRAAVRAVFEAERQHAVAARWTEGAFMFRNYRLDYSYYAKRAGGTYLSSASPAQIWPIITAIGGDNRYYFMNGLWKVREILDWLVGGQGLNYGRRHPVEVRLGDTIDSWRVIGVERERRLSLFFGMKAPGSGVLEFELSPEANGTRIQVNAHFHPAGVWGLLYWYTLIPTHQFMFKGLCKAIAQRAEARANTSENAP